MSTASGFRIVLQTGASAGIARVFALAFAYGAALAGTLVGLLLWAGELPPLHAIALPLVPVAFGGVALGALVATWRSRATDVLVGGDGMRVLGGAHAGLAVKWGEVDPVATGLVTNSNVTVTINGDTTPLRTLVLARRDGTTLTLAASTDPDEQLSLAAVVHTIREAAAPAPALADEGPPEVTRCPGCGAPVTPADAASVPCWRCDRIVDLPQSVELRVRGQAGYDAARGALERGIARLADQPTARTANGWLAASLVGPYLLPLGLCLGPGPWNAWVAGAVALNAASNLVVARRAAFHRLSVVFAARPAEAPGAPLRCRSCAGPLPTTDRVLVRCPWCEVDNLRTLQLDRPAALWRDAAGDLAAFLDEQRARLRWPTLVLGFWLLATVASAMLPALE